MMFETRSRAAAIVAALAATAGVGATAGAGTYALLSGDGKTVVEQVTVQGSQPAAQSNLSIPAIYASSYKGVVEITTTGAGVSPFGGQEERQAQGSGWVYDRDGHIVTNQHVVAGADSVAVQLWNGATYRATVVGSDRSTDLAVIDVDAPASVLQPLRLGDSGDLQVGDGVVAIGSPFGLEETITSGIVSALHRAMKAPNNFTITNSIQTDAAINHGNSGGPLLNAQGRVVGVNAQIESDSGGNDGVGFAIPSSTVSAIVPQLIGSGKAQHAYLGVGLDAIPENVAGRIATAAGVMVTNVVAGTPADKAGLRAADGQRTIDGVTYPTGGDVIVGFEDEKITSEQQLQNAVDAKQPGDEVTLTYVRGGDRRTATITLTVRPS
jgi:S1-C subfamily serine protease